VWAGVPGLVVVDDGGDVGQFVRDLSNDSMIESLISVKCRERIACYP
jgi:hypothetical protein